MYLCFFLRIFNGNEIELNQTQIVLKMPSISLAIIGVNVEFVYPFRQWLSFTAAWQINVKCNLPARAVTRERMEPQCIQISREYVGKLFYVFEVIPLLW